MAKKKAQGKKPSQERGKSGGVSNSPLGLLQQLLAELPDDQQLGLVEALMGGGGDIRRPLERTRGNRKLVEQADDLLRQGLAQPTVRAALPLLVRAEEVARKALGKHPAKVLTWHPDDPAAEMYCEAVRELVLALLASGQSEAAAKTAEEALALDPDDGFDVSELLLAAYFNLGRLEEAERLLQGCHDERTAWDYGRLLLALRRGERGAATDQMLEMAHAHNPHLLSLLLGERMLDSELPPFIEDGEDSEAQEYCYHFLPAWKATPGAITWLREAAGRLNLEISGDDDRVPPREITPREIASLPPHQLPTWIAGIHQMPAMKLPGEDEPHKRWLLFALPTEGGEALGFDFCEHKPTAGDLWQHLAALMAEGEQPGRPRTIRVSPRSLQKGLRSKAQRAGIELAECEHEEQLQQMLAYLSERMQGGTLAAQSVDAAAVQAVPLDADEVWEATVEQLPQRLEVAGQSLRPSIVLVMNREGAILWHELLVEPPAQGLLAAAVRMAITRPAVGPPRRPRQVFVRHGEDLLALQPLADEAGFVCEIGQELKVIDEAIAELATRVLGGGSPIALSAIEGVTHAELEQFFVAAAEFYRGQPWRKFDMDEVVALDQSQPPGPRRYALVMGQSGLTEGLAVYDQLRPIQNAFAPNSQADMITEADGFSVMYNEETHAPPADVDACEQFGWPVATPEAFPMAIRIHPGGETELPTAAELRMLTAALAGITRLSQSSEKSMAASAQDLSLTVSRLGWAGEL